MSTLTQLAQVELMGLEALPSWLQVILGLLSLVAVVAIFFFERRSRWLSYAILSNRAIVQGSGAFTVEVRHQGASVAQPRLVVWRVANGGVSEIDASEIESPITLRVSGANVLAAEVTHSRPPSFAPKATVDSPNEVSLEPKLMNSRDMVEVQMLLDGEPSDLMADARIAGIPRIRRAKVPRTSWDQPWKFGVVDAIVVALGLALVITMGVLLIRDAVDLAATLIGYAVAITGAILLPWMFWRSLRRNRLFLG